jgi:hypothetical protein
MLTCIRVKAAINKEALAHYIDEGIEKHGLGTKKPERK